MFFVLARGGKSHSWVTPTISWSNPRANRISVADGSRETMRMSEMYHNQGRIRGVGLSEFRSSRTRPLTTGTAAGSFVEQVFTPHLVKSRKLRGPTADDLRRRHIALELADSLRIPGQQKKFRGIELRGIFALKDGGDFEANAHGTHAAAVSNFYPDAAVLLPREQAAHRNERLVRKMHARQATRIQIGGDNFAVEPGRTKLLEGSFRPASHRNARILQDLQPGIKNRALQGAQIGRWRNPPQSRALKKIVVVPIIHGNHVKIAVNVIFRVEELREFADSHGIPNGRREIGHEGGLVGI